VDSHASPSATNNAATVPKNSRPPRSRPRARRHGTSTVRRPKPGPVASRDSRPVPVPSQRPRHGTAGMRVPRHGTATSKGPRHGTAASTNWTEVDPSTIEFPEEVHTPGRRHVPTSSSSRELQRLPHERPSGHMRDNSSSSVMSLGGYSRPGSFWTSRATAASSVGSLPSRPSMSEPGEFFDTPPENDYTPPNTSEEPQRRRSSTSKNPMYQPPSNIDVPQALWSPQQVTSAESPTGRPRGGIVGRITRRLRRRSADPPPPPPPPPPAPVPGSVIIRDVPSYFELETVDLGTDSDDAPALPPISTAMDLRREVLARQQAEAEQRETESRSLLHHAQGSDEGLTVGVEIHSESTNDVYTETSQSDVAQLGTPVDGMDSLSTPNTDDAGLDTQAHESSSSSEQRQQLVAAASADLVASPPPPLTLVGPVGVGGVHNDDTITPPLPPPAGDAAASQQKPPPSRSRRKQAHRSLRRFVGIVLPREREGRSAVDQQGDASPSQAHVEHTTQEDDCEVPPPPPPKPASIGQGRQADTMPIGGLSCHYPLGSGALADGYSSASSGDSISTNSTSTSVSNNNSNNNVGTCGLDSAPPRPPVSAQVEQRRRVYADDVTMALSVD
jgi:hypothetical protein